MRTQYLEDKGHELIENTRKHDTLDNRGQSRLSPDKDPGPLASGTLEFLGRSDAPDVVVAADAGDGEDVHSYVDWEPTTYPGVRQEKRRGYKTK